MKRLAVIGAALALVAVTFFVLVFLPASAPVSGLSAAGASACTPGAAFAPPAGAQPRVEPLTPTQVAKAAYAAGWRGADLVIAVAVAKAESTWNPTAINENTNGSVDYGLFQINSIHNAILARGDWRDPAANAVMAYQVWTDAGSSWRPWVGYWSGAYQQYLDEAQAAVATIGSVVSEIAGCSSEIVTAGGLADPGVGPQGADGMRPRAANIRAFTRTHWGCAARRAPCIPSIGGYARRSIAGTSTLSDHATGNAVDIMLSKNYRSPAENALGWEIARFWQANAAAVGVKYVIFNAKIWSAERADEGWRPYSHPGGGRTDTLQHHDHVHVSTLGG